MVAVAVVAWWHVDVGGSQAEFVPHAGSTGDGEWVRPRDRSRVLHWKDCRAPLIRLSLVHWSLPRPSMGLHGLCVVAGCVHGRCVTAVRMVAVLMVVACTALIHGMVAVRTHPIGAQVLNTPTLQSLKWWSTGMCVTITNHPHTCRPC